MARKLRIQFPGALYHIVNRGDRSEPIVRDDTDRERFIETLAQACQKTGWRVDAYCLLTDHFHLVVQTPEPNLVDGMKWFLGTYTARFNRRHATGGHLFNGRYKSQVLDSGDLALRMQAIDYLHLNPVRTGDVSEGNPLASFRWSSFPSYLAGGGSRPGWLEVSHVLAHLQEPDDSDGWKSLEARTEALRAEARAERWAIFRRGWYLGCDSFRRQLLDHLGGLRDDKSTGLVWRASAEQQAEKVIQRTLQHLGWQESDLTQRAKTDREKVFIAREIRKETTLPLTWIAARLSMGSRNTLRNSLAFADRAPAASASTSPFRSTQPPVKPRLPRPTRLPDLAPPPAAATSEQSFQVEPGWD
ncbi:MAG: transposase [Verrucomicrobiales bacterium]|nr:transposase [Verrucomicrobiales bacterium]